MLSQVMFADVSAEERKQLLDANCDSIEEKSYAKAFTSDELTQKRVELENVSINIADLEQEKKDFMDAHKTEMDPLKIVHKNIIKELKEKTVQVTEICFAFIDEETRTVGYYNADGLLIWHRPATSKEIQRTIQMEIRRTGTQG